MMIDGVGRDQVAKLRRVFFLLLGGITLLTPDVGDGQTGRAGAGNRVCLTEKMNGADVGAKVNSCDKELGSQPGEIRLSGGGNIATQIVISPSHTLRVISGVYSATTDGAVIRLRNNTSLVCDTWTPVLQESTGRPAVSSPFTIVTPYNGASADSPNGNAASNIVIRGCHFKGARSDFNSAPPTIQMGNCSNCRAEGNWLDATRSIGINVGGGSALGEFARNVTITNNQLTAVASQNISVTNAEEVTISRNRMLSPGQPGGPGVSVFDVEPNVGDRVQRVTFSDNLIDASKSFHALVSAGIVVQNGNVGRPFGGVVIKNNQVIGADPSQKVADFITYAGILVRSASGVLLEENYVQRVPRGILLDTNSSNVEVVSNRLASCGSGSTNALVIENSSGNRISKNNLYNQPGDALGLQEAIYASIVETGASDNNIFSGNRGRVSVAGARSRLLK